MTVYIVREEDYILGVYDTKEKAENEIIKQVKEDSTLRAVFQNEVAIGYFEGTIEDWIHAGNVDDYYTIDDREVE